MVDIGTAFGMITDMDTFDTILQRLAKNTRSELAGIAEKSGVPFHTLLKIASGETQNPRVRTVEHLQQYFEQTA